MDANKIEEIRQYIENKGVGIYMIFFSYEGHKIQIERIIKLYNNLKLGDGQIKTGVEFNFENDISGRSVFYYNGKQNLNKLILQLMFNLFEQMYEKTILLQNNLNYNVLDLIKLKNNLEL